MVDVRRERIRLATSRLWRASPTLAFSWKDFGLSILVCLASLALLGPLIFTTQYTLKNDMQRCRKHPAARAEKD